MKRIKKVFRYSMRANTYINFDMYGKPVYLYDDMPDIYKYLVVDGYRRITLETAVGNKMAFFDKYGNIIVRYTFYES